MFHQSPMAKHVNTVGIEIEPGAVHAAAVSVNGHIRIERAAMVSLDPGVVRDGEVNDVEALTEALKELYRQNKGLDKRIRVGIANQKIVVRVINLPPITDAKELGAAVRFQAPEEIPMPLDSAVMDYQPLGIVDTPDGPRQRVLIVAARRDMIDRVMEATRAAGLKTEGIDLAAFAMVRALYDASATPGPTLYLAIGGLTNLAVADGTNCLFTRVVGGGLESIAIELAERRALTLEHARGWLAHAGLSDNGHEVTGEPEIIADARTVLADGVRRIGGVMAVQSAVLTGAAAVVPGFADALAVELGMPVRTGIVDGVSGGLELSLVAIAAGLAVEEAPHS
jgi:type IV pilus assembly protein PilM